MKEASIINIRWGQQRDDFTDVCKRAATDLKTSLPFIPDHSRFTLLDISGRCTKLEVSLM